LLINLPIQALNVRDELVSICVQDMTTCFITRTPLRSKITFNRLILAKDDLTNLDWKWKPEVEGTSSNNVLEGEETYFASPHRTRNLKSSTRWNKM
jgi:hypothetical protein